MCEDIIDELIDDEAFTEMATVVRDTKRNFKIQVNPDRRRIRDPYFKIFNSAFPKERESMVARLHFKDEGMGYHQDGFLDWNISENDIKNIKVVLNESHKDFPQYNNWQMACYLWNYELDLVGDRDKYFEGKYDGVYDGCSSYISHDQKIPDTWIYSPPKEKERDYKK